MLNWDLTNRQVRPCIRHILREDENTTKLSRPNMITPWKLRYVLDVWLHTAKIEVTIHGGWFRQEIECPRSSRIIAYSGALGIPDNPILEFCSSDSRGPRTLRVITSQRLSNHIRRRTRARCAYMNREGSMQCVCLREKPDRRDKAIGKKNIELNRPSVFFYLSLSLSLFRSSCSAGKTWVAFTFTR